MIEKTNTSALRMSDPSVVIDSSEDSTKAKPEPDDRSMLDFVRRQLSMYFSEPELLEICEYLKQYPPINGFSVKHRNKSYVVYESLKGWTFAGGGIFRTDEAMIMRVLDHP
jgi:hypothetical protein